MRPPSLRIVVATVLACASGSCDSGPTGPIAGDLEFTIVSPNGPEGAALIELRAAGPVPVTSTEARVFTNRLADRTKILLVRTSPGTLTFRITVSDVRNPPTVSILEVAGGVNQLRGGLAGYRIESVAVTP